MRSLRNGVVKVLIILLVNLLSTECRNPVLHRVGGGRFSWNPNINFTNWSIHEQFYVGDWLYFGFDKLIYNVLEVNKTNYEKCEDKDFLTNVTRGGRDVFNLTDAKVFYFLSGRGFCFKGMKVAVLVKDFSEDQSLEPPHNNQHGDHDLLFTNNVFSSYHYVSHIIIFLAIFVFQCFHT